MKNNQKKEIASESLALKSQIKYLKKQLSKKDQVESTAIRLRQDVYRIKNVPTEIPDWTLNIKKATKSSPGVPTLLCSDWHWGEIVSPEQIGGVNKFNPRIARERVQSLVSTTIDLLFNHMVKPNYPGLVLALGGDMFSGDIHEELVESNAQSTLESVRDLKGSLIWMIDSFLTKFDNIFIPCVAGNHGRMTKKYRAKDMVYTNFDWHLYNLLYDHYNPIKKNKDGSLPMSDERAINPRVKFLIGDGSDVQYKIYNHIYNFTHGNQFRGGDGQIGHKGPVIRGDRKKRVRQSQVGQSYDTILHGHFHSLSLERDIIGNGCFPSGSSVITPSGVLNIEAVKVGDSVLSSDGSVQKVTNLFEKQSEEGLVHLKIRGLPKPLSATPNHLIWAVKGENIGVNNIGVKWRGLAKGGDKPKWIPIEFLSRGDFVMVPAPVGSDEIISEDLAWAYGLYLAEGSTLLDGGREKRHCRIVMTMHERELSVLDKFRDVMLLEDGMKGSTHIRTKMLEDGPHYTSEYRVSPGREKCVEFMELFGHTAKCKRMPDWFFSLANNIKRKIVEGWIEGDGHTTECGITSATTISETLAWQMFMLSSSAGMLPSMASLKEGGMRKNRSYTIHFNKGQETKIINGETFYRIDARYRDEEVKPVYDLEVSGAHTYCVEGVAVHNSLKGYDEYAAQGNFSFEKPMQALWLTHPKHGITISMPVHLTDSYTKDLKLKTKWVSIPEYS